MTAWDYPIVQPYGYDPSYPLNNGFHKGIDYGCPMGTPVTVNGVTIGLSGATGYVTGPHLHVGRWLNGLSTDPTPQGGKNVSGAVVTQVSSDSTNGNFVRVQDADGSSWVYLHLSQQLVTVGQVLQGGKMSTIATQDMVDSLAHAYLNDSIDKNPDLKFYVGQNVEDVINTFNSAGERDAYLKSIQAKDDQITQLKAQVGSASEANLLGTALIKLLATFGYKKG